MTRPSQEFMDRAREAIENGSDEEVDALFAEASQYLPLKQRFTKVLAAVLRDQGFDARSGGFGFQTGLVAAHLHPEWARACYLELLPTDEAREEADERFRELVALLPMVVEQETKQ